MDVVVGGNKGLGKDDLFFLEGSPIPTPFKITVLDMEATCLLFYFVFFCSGLRRAPGYGTNGEYETAPATEPGNSLKLHNIYNNLKSTLIAILA